MAPVEDWHAQVKFPGYCARQLACLTGWRFYSNPVHSLKSFILLATVSVFALAFHPASSQSVKSTELPIAKFASSAIAITRGGDLVVAANPDSNTISVIRSADNAVQYEINVGEKPVSVALAPDDATTFVANQGSNTVSVVDIRSGIERAQLPVGERPAGIAISPDGSLLGVAEFGEDRIRWIDAERLETLSVVAVDDKPYGLAFTPDGSRLLVSHLLDGAITVLDSRPHLAYFPFQASGYGASRSIHDAAASASSRRIPTWPNVAPAPAIIVNGDGTRAYAAQTMANGAGLNTQFDTTVFPKVTVIDLTGEQHLSSEHISLPETDRPVGLPWDLALAKNGAELWVVNSASNNISVVGLATPTHPVRVANVPVQDNPRGIVISPDGNRAYVNNTLAGTVSVIDTQTYTVLQVIRATTIPLPPALLRGKQLFYSSARSDLARASWVSCNTCHIEGEHDGRTWKLRYTGDVPPGEQPVIVRNTTSLLGMVETYPLRWSGEWDESADSEHSVRFEQFGTGLIQGEMNVTLGSPNQGRSYDLDCLAAYIDSLSLAAPKHILNERERRGKELFESPDTGCSDCHPAPLYTDLRSHDVGTASGSGEWFGPLIDTPTLRFSYDSAPYLHDGRAETLYDVLTTYNLSDTHGATSNLDEEDLRSLEAFLLALPYAEVGQ